MPDVVPTAPHAARGDVATQPTARPVRAGTALQYADKINIVAAVHAAATPDGAAPALAVRLVKNAAMTSSAMTLPSKSVVVMEQDTDSCVTKANNAVTARAATLLTAKAA